jgi:uncharacterized cupin superfamily protein
VVAEAELVQTEHGLVPEGEGWFVLNARDAPWWHTSGLGSACVFEGEQRFPELGFNVNVLPPGERGAMYHGENAQEDFLIVAGEAILIVEDEERPLKTWDFVHCPPWTDHVIVGAGSEPCVYVAVGARGKQGLRYPVSEAARRHDAGVAEETTDPKEAYIRFAKPVKGAYRPGDLPG